MLAMAKLAGYVSLLDQIGESFTHPKDFPSRFVSAVSAQVDFFMTYVLTNGLAGFSLEILQPRLLIWDTLRSCTCDREKGTNLCLYSLPYYRVAPLVSLYAVMVPLLLQFLVVYFFFCYVVFIN